VVESHPFFLDACILKLTVESLKAFRCYCWSQWARLSPLLHDFKPLDLTPVDTSGRLHELAKSRSRACRLPALMQLQLQFWYCCHSSLSLPAHRDVAQLP
jgi:hypothetical protein